MVGIDLAFQSFELLEVGSSKFPNSYGPKVVVWRLGEFDLIFKNLTFWAWFLLNSQNRMV